MTPDELSVIWDRVTAWRRGTASYPDAATDFGIVLEEVKKLKDIARTMCVLVAPEVLVADGVLVAELRELGLVE